MTSTSLSELVRVRRHFSLPQISTMPDHVCHASETIRRRWRDTETEETTENPEALALEMDHRRRTDDWQGFYWADATRTALTFLGSGLWREKRFAPLLDFLLDQVGPGGNRVYTRAMFRKYLETFDQRSILTRQFAERLAHAFEDDTLRMADMPIGPLVHHLHVFDVDYAPQAIATHMETHAPPFRALRDACGISPK